MSTFTKQLKDEAAWKRVLSGGSGAIVAATVLLFALSPFIAPGSLAPAPVLGMLPFAAVLAIAAAGQTLVIQQRGLDLSVPGMMALGGALVTALPQFYGWPLWAAVAAGVLMPGLVGLVNGILVTRFGVMPLVITLGMNAVLLGAVFYITSGTPAGALPGLHDFGGGRLLGVPNALLIAVAVVLVAGFISQRSIVGRRLTAVGVSQPAAAVVGVRIMLYQTMAYALAGVAYGLAGVLYAGYVRTPPLFFGDGYLLPTIAAVVLGGTALTGGRASLVSTAIAALFLTQLEQLLRAIGWAESMQLIVQAVVLLLVVLLRQLVPALVAKAVAYRQPRTAPAV